MSNKKTSYKNEAEILDNALDNYADVLQKLVIAIDNNCGHYADDGEQYIILQYIADELEEAKNLLKQ